jgi:hypothetical protein
VNVSFYWVSSLMTLPLIASRHEPCTRRIKHESSVLYFHKSYIILLVSVSLLKFCCVVNVQNWHWNLQAAAYMRVLKTSFMCQNARKNFIWPFHSLCCYSQVSYRGAPGPIPDHVMRDLWSTKRLLGIFSSECFTFFVICIPPAVPYSLIILHRHCIVLLLTASLNNQLKKECNWSGHRIICILFNLKYPLYCSSTLLYWRMPFSGMWRRVDLV